MTALAEDLSKRIAEIAASPTASEAALDELLREVSPAALLEAADALPERDRRAFLQAAASHYRLAGRAPDAAQCLARVTEMVSAPPEADRVWSDLSALYETQDRLEDAAHACRQAIEAARAAGDADREARHANRLGTILHQRGDRDGACEAYERALALNTGRPRVHALLNLASLHREAGDPRRALERVEQAWATPGLDPALASAAATIASHAALEAADAAAAELWRERAIERLRAAGDREGQANLLLGQASILLRQGRPDAAAQLLETVQRSGPLPSGLRARFEALQARAGAGDRRARLLARVGEILQAILTRRDARALLRDIVDSAVDLLGAERGFCLLNAADRIDVAVARNLDRETIQRPEFKISRHVADRAARQGLPLLTGHAGRDPELRDVPSIQEKQILSVLCVPLRVGEKILGALYLDNRLREDAFAPDDLEALETLGHQAAVGLLYAQLHEENVRQQKELEAVNARLRTINRRLAARVEEQTGTLRRVSAELEGRHRYDHLVGKSPPMQDLFRLLDRVQSSQEPVLITGESGTGKELLAQALHAHSPRKEGSFVSVNCAALSETLLESELFGHAKGAFTGATADHRGLFEAADRGTILLDEVGEMSPGMQSKLLRVLQEKEIRRVGDTAMRKVDVRVIAATNRDLKARVTEGQFREDLFYRLNVLHLHLPPLRERREDIPLLAAHLWEKIHRDAGKEPTALDAETVRRLEAHDWPGNVRQLENDLRRVFALGDAAVLAETRRIPAAEAVTAAPDLRSLEEVDLEHIRRVLAATKRNVTEAARILGIGVATLWRWIRKHSIPV